MRESIDRENKFKDLLSWYCISNKLPPVVFDKLQELHFSFIASEITPKEFHKEFNNAILNKEK